MLHKLRIAFSAGCGIGYLLLIALWVRSYSWNDISYCPLSATPRMLMVYSFRGRATIAAVVWHKDEPGPTGWGWESEFVARFVPPEEEEEEEEPDPLFEYHILKYGGYTRFLHWFAILIAGAASVAPWFRWRFSLRTLLIATTLVAVVLGLTVAFR